MRIDPIPESVGSNSQSARKTTLVAWGFPRGLKPTIWVNLLMVPLLFLVAGLSQLSAAVIYTPVSGNYSVGTGDLAGSVLLTIDLPGLNDLAVVDFSYNSGSVPRSNFYQLTILNPGTAFIAADIFESLYYAHSLNANETWVDLPVGQVGTTNGANISRMAQTGNSAFLLRSNPTYLPFRFTDSTDSITKYGYIALATSVTGSDTSAQFNLNISGYAYDTSGAPIAMGAVPEPSTALSTALGILGVVAAWRCRRTKSGCR